MVRGYIGVCVCVCVCDGEGICISHMDFVNVEYDQNDNKLFHFLANFNFHQLCRL